MSKAKVANIEDPKMKRAVEDVQDIFRQLAERDEQLYGLLKAQQAMLRMTQEAVVTLKQEIEVLKGNRIATPTSRLLI